MKKLKLILTIALIFISVVNLSATDSKKEIKNAKDLINEGLIKWDEGKFFQASSICERIYNNDENPYAKYYQTFAQANILQKAMVERDIEKFNRFYDAAVENAKLLRAIDELKSEAEVLLAHIYMSKISVSPNEAPAIIGNFYAAIEKALAMDSNNPRAIVLKATMLFYTPEAFGGDVKGAIKLFEEAIPLYEKTNENELIPDWGYLDLTATLGMAYTKIENFDKAKDIYTKALERVPNYGRIKFSLLPQLEKKIKERK